MEMYIRHFLEAARFLNTPVLAGRKVNVLYALLICIKFPMNLFFNMALAPYDFAAGQRHYLGPDNLDFFGAKWPNRILPE